MNTKNMSERPVVLFGEILADIFPDQSVLGGAPFNVARHLAAFGRKAVLISRFGQDTLREDIVQEMTSLGMDIQGIQTDSDHPTGRVLVHLEEDGHRFEIQSQQAYDFIHPADAHHVAFSIKPSLIYFGTLAQRHHVSANALKSILRHSQALRFSDLNLRAPWYDEKRLCFSLEQANFIKLNSEELQILATMFQLFGTCEQDQALELVRRFRLERVIVTCSAEGVWQVDAQGKIGQAGAGKKALHLVDTVGAGDAFAAAYILGLLHDWSQTLTLERANAFAASICEIRGAVPRNTDFYDPFRQEWML